MRETIDISIVAATHNRSDLLQELLKSFEKQTYAPSRFEVIIACDGCTDNTFEILEGFKSKIKNLTWLKLPKGNPAKARNAGVKHAKGKIIAFTDDDCIASGDWLEVIYQNLNKGNLVGLQGKTTTDPSKVHPLTHQIENLHGHPAVPTCNAAFLRESLLKIGIFDEGFPFAHNEDADLAWRMRKEGEITFVPEMIIHHPPRLTTLKKSLSRMKILESEFMLFHKDPTLYKLWRNDSPWKTIYKEVFIKHQMLLFKSRFKYINRPVLLLKGLLISLSWWVDLILKYPRFAKANKHYKEIYQQQTKNNTSKLAA